MSLIFDGHLDIAYNAISHERDATLSVDATREREADPPCTDGRGTCTTSLHEMREAGVAVAVTTLLARCKPWVKPGREKSRWSGDWPSPAMAHAVASAHLAYYQELQRQSHVRILRSADELTDHWQAWADNSEEGFRSLPIGLILTMECADPIVEPDQLEAWHAAGLRTLMLTHFGMGRYAAGSIPEHAPNPFDIEGPVSELGVELLNQMQRLNMPLDLSHLSDTSFWDAMQRFDGRVYASHCNCRALAPGQRQLSDDMIRAIIERDGIIGLALYFGMLQPDWRQAYEKQPLKHVTTLETVADHIDHVVQLAGDTRCVAIGSDLDGGFGAEECPNGFDRHRDLHPLAEILCKRGYADLDLSQILGGNWLRFFTQTLP